MTDSSWDRLRDRFTVKYENFRTRLRRRLGSDDLAREALQETWLQLARAVGPRAIERPDAYLFATALNVAAGLKRSEARHASRVEVEAAMDLADEAAGPLEVVESRFDIEELERAIDEMPHRRRMILLSARVELLPIQEIADRLGLSRRSVQEELKRAIEHCAARLGRGEVRRSDPERED